MNSAVGNQYEKVELDNKREKQLIMKKALGTKYFYSFNNYVVFQNSLNIELNLIFDNNIHTKIIKF